LQDRSSIILRLLLNRFHKGPMDAVLKLLPEETAKKVSSISIQTNNVGAAINVPFDVLKTVHYSWLVKELHELPESILIYLLGLLPFAQATKLKDALKLKNEIPSFSKAVKPFVVDQVFPFLPFRDAPPFTSIPESEMSKLAWMKKKELVEVIDFLGLYDLAEEVHNIVDKKILEKIYASLTPKKQSYLKKCLRSKEKLVTNRLNLEYWDGDNSKLLKLLHHRGLVRLGYALCGQDAGLIWHITHILDEGRGKKLLRYINEKDIPGVTKTLREQIQDVSEFFNKVRKQ
jgi:hypothetical protein